MGDGACSTFFFSDRPLEDRRGNDERGLCLLQLGVHVLRFSLSTAHTQHMSDTILAFLLSVCLLSTSATKDERKSVGKLVLGGVPTCRAVCRSRRLSCRSVREAAISRVSKRPLPLLLLHALFADMPRALACVAHTFWQLIDDADAYRRGR